MGSESISPTQLKTRAVRNDDYYVINGRKWFTSNAIGAAFAIAMVVTDPDAEPHRRASQIVVPLDTPGMKIGRPVSVMGHTGGGGHCEVLYTDCKAPVTNLLDEEGGGFAISQARLGPGRIHHCMRSSGAWYLVKRRDRREGVTAASNQGCWQHARVPTCSLLHRGGRES